MRRRPPRTTFGQRCAIGAMLVVGYAFAPRPWVHQASIEAPMPQPTVTIHFSGVR